MLGTRMSGDAGRLGKRNRELAHSASGAGGFLLGLFGIMPKPDRRGAVWSTVAEARKLVRKAKLAVRETALERNQGFAAIGMASHRVAVVMILVAAVAAGCERENGLVRGTEPEAPVEERGPMSVQVVETWRTGVDPEFDGVAGMAAWADGTIWVGDGQSVAVWELQSDGSGARKMRWSDPATDRVDEVRQVAVVGDSSFLILGRDQIDMGARTGREARHLDLPPLQTWGFVALADGGFVVSGGGYPGDPHYDNSVHRFDRDGTLTASWHPAFEHEDWRVVNYLTGSAVGMTSAGDLLVSDLAPFRITRYPGINPHQPVLLVEDEEVISSSELTRATAPNSARTIYQFRWNRSRYVGEMVDGKILNVSLYYSDRRGRPYSLWTVVATDGSILASTRHDKAYYVWNRTPDGMYLASYDGYVMTLAVSVVPAEGTAVGSGQGGSGL